MTTTLDAPTAPLSSVVAANIRAECARRSWTQQQLADKLGMNRIAVSDRHRERTPWTLDETQKVADLMGLEIGDLTARPKGFEPLTFWLGAEGVAELFPLATYEGVWRGFCHECGHHTDGVVVDPTAWADEHARRVHKGGECSGGDDCAALIHWHGCYADRGNCDETMECPAREAVRASASLAEGTDISTAGMSRRLSGGVDLTFHEVETIAAALGVKVADLIERAERQAIPA